MEQLKPTKHTVPIETLKTHNFTEDEIAAMHKYVNEKNEKRGYL